MMNQFKEVTFPEYVTFCTSNLSNGITNDMKPEDIKVTLLPLPATEGVLHFEVESTIRLASMPGIDLSIHA